MPRPRKPTEVLKFRGAFKEHAARERKREHEPAPVGVVGEPPDHLPENVAAAWRDLVRDAHAGVLCEADREFMAYAATIVAATRELSRQGIVDVKLGVRFEAVIARLGMSPADRSRVSAAPGKPAADPLAEFRVA
jgi:hypothetical protein